MSTEQQRDDYDSRADKFWSIYNKEAESYDRALMETWKDDMDSIIIFAGLFSAVLTAFLVDTSRNLKADPTDQTNALLSQTVVLLAQISQQLGPNGSQTIISLPQQLEPFKVDSSYLRVNIFWFMSLGFSITAALGATLVQQWVRDYLQVFQRLSGSLERSRMRQFLFHGLASNHMHLLVECIPTFIHISLFLFFVGLADSLFSTNKAVAITTTTIIGFCALFYIACSFSPVLYAQTPFHTPFSNILWKLGQIIRPRKYSDRNTGGRIVPVSSDMAKGRLQLAMGRSNDRMTRDMEAICWMLTKITEDSEFEPFIASIGGSFATPWGRDVWKNILTGNRESPGIMTSTFFNAEVVSNTLQALKIRIESLLHSCTVSTFPDHQTRFARTCVCIDAVALFRLGFKAELELYIDNDLMNKVLQHFGDEKKRRDKLLREVETSSGSAINLYQLPGNQVMDTSLEIKWKCLVLIGMKQTLRWGSEMASAMLFYGRCAYSEEYRSCDAKVITSKAREVDYELLKAWNAARQLFSELCKIPEEQLTENGLNELVPRWRDHIEAMQESLYALNLRVHPSIDSAAVHLCNCLIQMTGGALEHLEGIFYEWPPIMNPAIIRAMFKGINWGIGPPDSLKWLMPHLIPPRLFICHLLVYADPRRRPNFDPSTSRIDLVGLGGLLNNPEMQRLFDTQRVADKESGGPQPYVNQFWRFKDITEHEGTGFMIEMFFATFRSLEQESLTSESTRLIEATLRVIFDNRKSAYFKIARRQFLWALRQALSIPRKVVDVEQLAEATKAPSTIIVEMLQNIFYASDEDRPKEDRNDQGASEKEEEENE